MGIEELNEGQVKKMSMVELANLVLMEEKKEMSFLNLYEKIAILKSYSEATKTNNVAQFYTDLNVDGRFIALGSNVWGLKQWFPVSQTSEKALTEARIKEENDLVDDEFYDEEEPEEEHDKEIDFDSYDDEDEE